MFQNFIQDVLNRVDGTTIVNGTVTVLASASRGDICRVNRSTSSGFPAIELEIDPSKNTMVTFDLNLIISETDYINNPIAFAAIVNDAGANSYSTAGTVQTLIPRILSSFGAGTSVSIKGAVNVPKVESGASGKYSCIIAFMGKGNLYGIARAHYSDFHTFQPNK